MGPVKAVWGLLGCLRQGDEAAGLVRLLRKPKRLNSSDGEQAKALEMSALAWNALAEEDTLPVADVPPAAPGNTNGFRLTYAT